MRKIRGRVPVAAQLDRKSCYRLLTGRCSLELVDDFELAFPLRLAPSELLYCPRLARMMQDRERDRTLAVTPCACGHAEADGAPQKVCIAERLGIEPVLIPSEKEARELCSACGRQLTFEEGQPDREGARLYELRAVARAQG